jgi:hypothetical protein
LVFFSWRFSPSLLINPIFTFLHFLFTKFCPYKFLHLQLKQVRRTFLFFQFIDLAMCPIFFFLLSFLQILTSVCHHCHHVLSRARNIIFFFLPFIVSLRPELYSTFANHILPSHIFL